MFWYLVQLFSFQLLAYKMLLLQSLEKKEIVKQLSETKLLLDKNKLLIFVSSVVTLNVCVQQN